MKVERKGFISMISILNRLNFQELKDLFKTDKAMIKDGEDDSEHVWFSEIATKIAFFDNGLDFLLKEVPIADEVHLCAILTALSFTDSMNNKVYSIVRSSIHDTRASVIAQAIDTATVLGYRDLLDDVISLLDHPSSYVVGSALRFLSRHYPDNATPLLLQALQADDPILVENGIDELDRLGHTQSVHQIRDLQNHADARVRRAARVATVNLERLLGFVD